MSKHLIWLLIGASLAGSACADDALWTSLANPPPQARPLVWWQWMNGNFTQASLQKDLDWLHSVNIGGVQVSNIDLFTPQLIPHPANFLSADWSRDLVAATTRANQYNMQIGVFSSAGWSSTGGPWVQPAQAMKKLVWSRTTLDAGSPATTPLPALPDVAGVYQGLPGAKPLSFVRDAAVIAYPLPADEENAPPSITNSHGQPLPASLDDDSAAQIIPLTPDADGRARVLLHYPTPTTIRSAWLVLSYTTGFGAAPAPVAWLEASTDGRKFRRIADFPQGSIPVSEIDFAPVTAAWFRLVIAPGKTQPMTAAPGTVPIVSVTAPPFAPRLAEWALSGAERVRAGALKAGFGTALDYDALPTPEAPASSVVDPARVLDLTSRLDAHGVLHWHPASGRWTVLRLGYSLTGATNEPAAPDATGLEVDKFDPTALTAYLTDYVAHLPPQALRRMQTLTSDSTEAGPANWTPAMLAEFQRRRGYDPRPYLPVLTGVIVGSAAKSDLFLNDYRRTIAEMAAESYATIAQFAHQHGWRYYNEALEDHRPQLGDDLQMRRYADVPMGAMWASPTSKPVSPTYTADLQGAASVAHFYGNKLVGCECMTAYGKPWGFAPSDLRPVVDHAFALGVNALIIHASPAQIGDQGPGVALAPALGQPFDRNEVWAPFARSWVDYLARNNALLRQGTPAPAYAYLAGEDTPLTALFGDHGPTDAPRGYGYDFLDGPMLAALKVSHGKLVAPSGLQYPALYVGNTAKHLTLASLRKLLALRQAGALIFGQKPQTSPSLADDPAAVERIEDQLWPHGGTKDLAATLEAAGIPPDIKFSSNNFVVRSGDLLFIRRHLLDGDLYFISNQSRQKLDTIASFPISNKGAEIWSLDPLERYPAKFDHDFGNTSIGLGLPPGGSLYVRFRKGTKPVALINANPAAQPNYAIPLANPWELDFPAGPNPPAARSVNSVVVSPTSKGYNYFYDAGVGSYQVLPDWITSSDPKLRYFSGLGRYRTSFMLPTVRTGFKYWLELGRVGDMARVSVNGKIIADLWHEPYQVDIGKALHPGVNHLEITVANLWVNRLIGDAVLHQKFTFVTGPTYTAQAPLRASGLIGPVMLIVGPNP